MKTAIIYYSLYGERQKPSLKRRARKEKADLIEMKDSFKHRSVFFPRMSSVLSLL